MRIETISVESLQQQLYQLETADVRKKMKRIALSVSVPLTLAAIDVLSRFMWGQPFAARDLNSLADTNTEDSVQTEKQSVQISKYIEGLQKNNQCGRLEVAYTEEGLLLRPEQLETLSGFIAKEAYRDLGMPANKWERWQDIQAFSQQAKEAAAYVGQSRLNETRYLHEGFDKSYVDLVKSLNKFRCGPKGLLFEDWDVVEVLKKTNQTPDTIRVLTRISEIQAKAMNIVNQLCQAHKNIQTIEQKLLPSWIKKIGTPGSVQTKELECEKLSDMYEYRADKIIPVLGKHLILGSNSCEETALEIKGKVPNKIVQILSNDNRQKNHLPGSMVDMDKYNQEFQCKNLKEIYQAEGTSVDDDLLRELASFRQENWGEYERFAGVISAKDLEKWEDVKRFYREAGKAILHAEKNRLKGTRFKYQAGDMSYTEAFDHLPAGSIMRGPYGMTVQMPGEKLSDSEQGILNTLDKLQKKAMAIARNACKKVKASQKRLGELAPIWTKIATQFRAIGGNISSKPRTLNCRELSRKLQYDAVKIITELERMEPKK